MPDVLMPDALALNEAEEYQALLEFLSLCPTGIAQFDAAGAISMMNPAFACITMPLLGPGEVCTNLLDLLQPYVPELRHLLSGTTATGTVCDALRVPLGVAAPGGDQPMLSLTVVRFGGDQHMAVITDITRQVAHERRLQETEAYFAAFAQGVEEYALISVDGDGRISDWNASAQRLFGHAADAVIGTHAGRLVTTGRPDAASFRARLREAARTGWHVDEGWRQRHDGSRFWGTCMLSPYELAGLEGEPPVSRYLLIVRDTTERRNAAEELRRALTRDHLTGVLNRRTFLERAGAELQRRAAEGAVSCVAMVDADHFKAVNDTHGHAGGDAALRAIADTLSAGTRGDDFVGRLGGEEFAVLMPATDAAAAAALAERLRATVAGLALDHAGCVIPLTVSIGLAAGTTADLRALLAQADAALYAAKRDGRNCVRRAAVEAAPAPAMAP